MLCVHSVVKMYKSYTTCIQRSPAKFFKPADITIKEAVVLLHLYLLHSVTHYKHNATGNTD